jgi:hypothetical protein
MNQCINCQAETAGKFCANCGQRISVKRITFREGWNDFWARIYGFDGMFPNTLRDLTIRPGEAARTYIAGNRARYYGPVGYFFLMLTVFLLLLDLLSMDGVEFFKEMGKSSFSEEIKSGSPQEKVVQVIFQFMTDYMKVIFFAMIPVQAFYSRYLFFRKSGYNFVENMILPLYATGHVYWLSIITVIIFKLSGVFLRNNVGAIISTCYIGYAYANLFAYQPKWKGFLKGIATYYFSLVTFMLIAFAALLTLIYFFPDIKAVFQPLK